ncbi:MAG: hypothetical protein ABSA67_02220 [Candidatus Brocadiia bacterium]|jgi:hypothetical protein
MADLTELQSDLAGVKATIRNIVANGVSSVGRSGRQATVLDLPALQRREKDLMQQIAAAQGAYQPVGVRFKEVPGAGVTAFDPEHNYMGPGI